MGQIQRAMLRKMRRENLLSVRESARRMNLDPSPDLPQKHSWWIWASSWFLLGGLVKWFVARKLISA